MWLDTYNNLTNAERERFSKLLNYLLNKTFVCREIYETKDKIGKINADYRFIEKFYDLFEEVFSIYFDTDINKIKTVVLRVLRDEQVHENEIARIDKINEVSELIDFLIFRAKNKGEFPEISEQEDTFIIKKTEDPVVIDQNFSQINTSFRINADLPYINDYVGDRKKELQEIDFHFDKNPLLFLTGVGGIGKSICSLLYGKHKSK